jgi:hypothetical protein
VNDRNTWKPRVRPMLLLAFFTAIMSNAQTGRTPLPPPLASGQEGGILGDCGHAPDGAGHGNLHYVLVYRSNQSAVCVEFRFWSTGTNASDLSAFFPYFDAVVRLDKVLFPIETSGARFVFELAPHVGGGHTGCHFPKISGASGYCDTVDTDSITNVYTDRVSRQRVRGFWGYLLPLHESINVFTGLLSGGWPSDWWADHRSPFPNAMDIEFMQFLSEEDNGLSTAMKRALHASAKAQSERFTDPNNPTGEYDSEVVMFLDFFKHYGGFDAYARSFRYAFNQDRLQLPVVSKFADYTGDNNHSENLTEYVMAYLFLGFGVDHDLTPVFREAGVGTLDKKIPPYSIQPENIKLIADAHCSIHAAISAGLKVNKQIKELQDGNFEHAIAHGGTAQSCPAECTFTENSCRARF